jgi:hypothetical protein
MTARATPSQIRRTLEAARAAGLTVTGYEVDGALIRVFTTGREITGPANDQTDELAALAARIGNHAARRS